MKAYKGFHKNDDGTLQCRYFTYEIGKTYRYDGKICLCGNGFHACHKLYQTWYFYPNNGKNVYYEVECGGNIIEGNGKFVCSEITLLKEVDISDIAKFDDCLDFIDGVAIVRLNNKRSFINTKGKIVFNQWFDYCWCFNDCIKGFAKVKLNNKMNFINIKGEYLSEQWFDDCCNFIDGFSRVELDGKYNFINTKGEIISKQWFNWCWYSVLFKGYRIKKTFS